MAKFVAPCLLICFAFIHSGYAFKCYACDSGRNPECSDPNNLSKIPLTECSAAGNNMGTTESACVKYILQDRTTNVMTTFRKCLLYTKGSRPCDTIQKPNINTDFKSCDTCQSDACNAAIDIRSTTSLSLLFPLILLTFIQYIRA